MKTVLELKNVSQIFDKSTIFSNASFKVQAGDFISIVGKSGAGKSTLLRLIAQLIKPSKGEIRTPKRSGFVFQEAKLVPWLTLEKNVALAVNKYETDSIPPLLKKVGLNKLKNRYPSQLSGGEAKRAALIRALATKPEMLLLDEPFSALDWITRQDIYKLVENIHNERKLTTILVTHDIEEALKLSTRILVLLKDRITEIKTKDKQNVEQILKVINYG